MASSIWPSRCCRCLRAPFEARTVLRDPWILVVQEGAEHARLTARAPLRLQEIGQLPLVSFRLPRAIDAVLDRFRAAGVEPNILLRSDYNDAGQELAAAGLGVALMPRLAFNPHDERTSTVGLGDLVPPREIAVAWHSDRTASESFEAFVSIAREVGAGLEAGSPTPVEWRRTAAR
ncbi:hypothetical protein BH09ACT13_BH09ACT13_16410 [soil metagenome]